MLVRKLLISDPFIKGKLTYQDLAGITGTSIQDIQQIHAQLTQE